MVPETMAARRSRMISEPSEAMSLTGSIGTTLDAELAMRTWSASGMAMQSAGAALSPSLGFSTRAAAFPPPPPSPSPSPPPAVALSYYSTAPTTAPTKFTTLLGRGGER